METNLAGLTGKELAKATPVEKGLYSAFQKYLHPMNHFLFTGIVLLHLNGL